MTVKELIEELLLLDQNAQVKIESSLGEYSPRSIIRIDSDFEIVLHADLTRLLAEK
jgi:hypothetical protein